MRATNWVFPGSLKIIYSPTMVKVCRYKYIGRTNPSKDWKIEEFPQKGIPKRTLVVDQIQIQSAF